MDFYHGMEAAALQAIEDGITPKKAKGVNI